MGAENELFYQVTHSNQKFKLDTLIPQILLDFKTAFEYGIKIVST